MPVRFVNPFNFFSFITVALLSGGCSRDIPSDPNCRLANHTPAAAPDPAACLVKLDSKLLMLTLTQSPNLHLPTGLKTVGVSAQCSAHLATWKATGLNVEVRDLLFTAHGIHYYDCAAHTAFPEVWANLPVPEWATHRINSIEFINVFAIKQEQLAANLELIQLRQGYTKLTAHSERRQ